MIIHRVEHNRRRLRMQVHVCEGRYERGRGLLLRRQLDAETAWLLPECRAVHTIGMHYRLDLLFCDANGRILRIEEHVAPCRIARERRACQVWELRSGAVRHWGWRVGDQIRPC
jgi:uncharacterized membrane protein (UPF0127 family)